MNLLTNARDALNEKYPEFDQNKAIIDIESEEGNYTKFILELPVDNGWNL